MKNRTKEQKNYLHHSLLCPSAKLQTELLQGIACNSVGKIPCRREWKPTPVFLHGEVHGQRSLAGYSPWGCKEPDTTEQLTLCETLIVVTSQINWSFIRAQGLVVGDCPLRLGSNHTSSVKFSLPYSSKGNFTSFGILVLHYFYKSKYWYFCWYSSMNPQGAGSIILPGFFQMLVLCNSFCPILPPQLSPQIPLQ